MNFFIPKAPFTASLESSKIQRESSSSIPLNLDKIGLTRSKALNFNNKPNSAPYDSSISSNKNSYIKTVKVLR